MGIKTLEDIKQIKMAEESEAYKAFTEKFKPKHTSDDCFTPDNIYQVVKAWAFRRYELPEDTEVERPFFPGGDYQREEYPEGCVVLDNPPFSIASQICKWYMERGIRFFLFANGLTAGNVAWKIPGMTAISSSSDITYDNGAHIMTGFVTNMSPGILVESAPDLHREIEAANKINVKRVKKQITKLALPNEIVTMARMNYLTNHGIKWQVRQGEGTWCRALDNLKGGIFGGGLLLCSSAAERAAAERAVVRIELTEREKAIIRELDEGKA